MAILKSWPIAKCYRSSVTSLYVKGMNTTPKKYQAYCVFFVVFLQFHAQFTELIYQTYLNQCIKIKWILKARNKTSIWPSNPTFGHIPWENHKKDMSTPMFIAALVIIARTQKQPRCPLTYECIKKLWYMYTMKYQSAMESNECESVELRWMNPEPVI